MKKCTSCEEQKGTRYIRGNVYFRIIVFSWPLSTKSCPRFILICFAQEIKPLSGLLSESPRKWGWFQGHNDRFLKYLGLKLKFQKTETCFCIWKNTDNNDINVFSSLENLCTFLLAEEKTWKRIFNTNCKVLQNCTGKQIMPSRIIINWLFNDIWCYLFIACFDWKIGVFQQRVLRVYYILKNVLRGVGTDTKILKAHSTRSASTSKAGLGRLPVTDILERGFWINVSTWHRFFKRQVQSSAEKWQNKVLN